MFQVVITLQVQQLMVRVERERASIDNSHLKSFVTSPSAPFKLIPSAQTGIYLPQNENKHL